MSASLPMTSLGPRREVPPPPVGISQRPSEAPDSVRDSSTAARNWFCAALPVRPRTGRRVARAQEQSQRSHPPAKAQGEHEGRGVSSWLRRPRRCREINSASDATDAGRRPAAAPADAFWRKPPPQVKDLEEVIVLGAAGRPATQHTCGKLPMGAARYPLGTAGAGPRNPRYGPSWPSAGCISGRPHRYYRVPRPASARIATVAHMRIDQGFPKGHAA
jgi:hypothetical protein